MLTTQNKTSGGGARTKSLSHPSMPALSNSTDTFQTSSALQKKKSVSFGNWMSEVEKAAARLKLSKLDDEAAKLRQVLRESESSASKVEDNVSTKANEEIDWTAHDAEEDFARWQDRHSW